MVITPESAYGGSPTTAQATLERTKARLLDGTYDALPQELRAYLVSRITPDAARGTWPWARPQPPPTRRWRPPG